MAIFRFKFMVPAHKPVNASLSAHAGKSGQLTDGTGTVNRLKAILAIQGDPAPLRFLAGDSPLQSG
ncbi:hypothetical protein C8024_08175 [Sphingopyxis sp. BSNA05]|nr:hypothetical protein CHN51_03925 [Sphingorhabdus sp. YGSMI21]NRD89428.1 hypothetical protein [Sphingopyxis sp. BSNA05]